MAALGHERFAVVGHDTGYIIYALAADHPHRVDRVALAEIPGSPVVASSPPLFVPEPVRGASRGAERRLYDPDPEAAGILSEAASSASVGHLQSYSTDLRQIRCASKTGQVAKGAVSRAALETSSSGHADHPSGPVRPCCSGAGSIGSSSSSWAFALALSLTFAPWPARGRRRPVADVLCLSSELVLSVCVGT